MGAPFGMLLKYHEDLITAASIFEIDIEFLFEYQIPSASVLAQ